MRASSPRPRVMRAPLVLHGVALALALTAGLVLGCVASTSRPEGGPSDTQGLWRSGTRLRARVQRADVGAAVFLGWHDTALDIDCAWRPDTEGVQRCIPSNFVAYADAECTVLGIALGPDQIAPRYASASALGAAGCLAPIDPDVRVVDAEHVSSIAFQRDAEGTCTPFPPPVRRVAPFGASVPVSMLASGTLQRVPVGARFLQHVVVGDDGSEQRLPVLDDATLGTSCTFDADRGLQCLPPVALFDADGSPYADAACTVRSASVSTSGCVDVTARFAARVPPPDPSNRCAPFEVLPYEVGAPVAQLYTSTTGTCTPWDPPMSGSFSYASYSVGAPLPADTFGHAERSLRGSGALRVRTLDVEGTPVAAATLLRTPDDHPCLGVRRNDTETLCVPGPVVQTFGGADQPFPATSYADAACTIALVSDAARCTSPAMAIVLDPTTAHALRAYRTEPIDPGPRWSRTSSGCAPAPSSTPSDTMIEVRVLEEVDLDGFPRLTLVTE